MKKLSLLLISLALFLFVTGTLAEGRRVKHLAGYAQILVGLQADGTVKATGINEFGQCDTSTWRDVVEVAVGFDHTLGLKADGTVYAAGDNRNGQCNVQDWTDIVMIAAGASKSIGLKSDGTVVYAGFSYEDTSDMKNWRNIVWVGADWSFCGVDKDGNVFGTFEFDVSGFHDAVQVYEDANITYVLNTTGDVHCLSEFADNYESIIDISDLYSNICELGRGGSYFAALRRDGTVKCDAAAPYFAKWTDIVEFESGFGVKPDGSIVMEQDFVDDFTPEQLAEISTWKVMVDPDSIPVPPTQMAVP